MPAFNGDAGRAVAQLVPGTRLRRNPDKAVPLAAERTGRGDDDASAERVDADINRLRAAGSVVGPLCDLPRVPITVCKRLILNGWGRRCGFDCRRAANHGDIRHHQTGGIFEAALRRMKGERSARPPRLRSVDPYAVIGTLID